MSITTYILDSVLVLLVLLQIKERPFSYSTMIRPLVTVGIAVVIYLNTIPTGGNDLLLVGVTALTGAIIGIASGQSLIMRRLTDGTVTVRAGWASAIFWVLGMGSRFAFTFWISHSGAHDLVSFSAHHDITSAQAWTVALLAMAVAEVLGRMAVVAARHHALKVAPTASTVELVA